jgi:hypothetical protein
VKTELENITGSGIQTAIILEWESKIKTEDNPHPMSQEEMMELKKEIFDIKSRLDSLERELRLMNGPGSEARANKLVEIEGGFFETMNALRTLYLDQEEDAKMIRKISRDIEKGNIKVDMIELFFRFFVRQEIQNARVKLLLLSQRLRMDPVLFDHLDDLSVLIDDPRYSIHQVIIGWKRFERMVSEEINRLKSK